MAEDKNIKVEMKATGAPSEQEWAETNRKVRELFQSIEEEFLRTKPLWMRLNLLLWTTGHGCKVLEEKACICCR